MNKKDLGLRIRNLRIEAKLTQEELAEAADISPVYLGEVERGQKVMGIDKFINIVKALGVSADCVLCNELPTGEPYVFDELTEKLKKLDPKQRKVIAEIINTYVKNVL